ncbi:MAG: ABC transporter ATP-binding protein [Armatimonadetes bacterium]|nr:ABC transporter ATP-binding protein [Armatimonadota bacterium]
MDANSTSLGGDDMSEGVREQLPDDLRRTLRALLGEDEAPRMVLSADVDHQGRFGASWLVVTERRLLVLSAASRAETPADRRADLPAGAEKQRRLFPRPNLPPPHHSGRSTRRSATPRPPTPAAAEERHCHVLHLSLSRIAEVKARETVGSGALQVTLNGEKEGETPTRVDVIRFSRALLLRFGDAAHELQLLCRAQAEPAGSESAPPRPRRKPKARCARCGRVLPPGTETCLACVDKGKVLLRLLVYLGPYWKLSLLSLLASVGLTVLALTPPYLMQILIDDVLMPRRGSHLLYVITGALAGVHLVRLAIGAGRDWLNAWLGQRVYFDLRTQIFRHLQKLSMGFYDRKQVGGVLSRITSDASTLHVFLVGSAQRLLINVLTVFGIAVVLLAMNWRLALIVLLPTPLLIVATIWFGKRIRVIYRRYWRLLSQINAMLVSSISGVRVVRSFGQEPREIHRFEGRSTDYLNTALDAARLNVRYYPSMSLITVISSILIWLIGGASVLSGQLSLGTLTAFTSYMWQFYGPITVLCEINDVLQQAATAAERVFEVMDTQPDIADAPGAVRLDPIQGRVVFRDVCFSYDEHEALEPLLKQINIEVEPGEIIGLVGHSGSGKSTLINLILRFYDPTSGEILLDGVDLRRVQIECLREQMAVVLQEPFLFRGTIAENIAYGRTDVTRDEIIAAAKAANAHHFVTKFPDGYDTEVGERGGRLSGGERQRVSIARAILSNPRILILDEATASVDTETEKLIQEAMERLMRGRTCFVIAHRLSTLRTASRLVVLDDGRVAEVGTHEELLAKEDGIYARLARIQMEMAKSIAA